MDISQVSIGLAFLAGLASFFSPCVFSLVPAYIGYLGGRAASGEGKSNRWTTFSHGLAFVLGFSVIFILLGVTLSFASGLRQDVRFWLPKIGGLVVVVFGLQMIGLIHIPFLMYDTRVNRAPDPKWGYFSSALMGIFFSAGWSPCVGPTLSLILTFAASGGSVSIGFALLSAYSMGLAIPFLVAALGIDWVTVILRKYNKVMRYVEIAMGILLVIVGVMLFTGIYEKMALFFPNYYIDFGV